MSNNEELEHYLVSDLGFKKNEVAIFLSRCLDVVDLVLDQETGHRAKRLHEGDSEFDFEAIELVLDEESGCRANGFDGDDTDLEYETGELVLEQWSQHQESSYDQDDTILEYQEIEEDDNLKLPK